MIKYCIFDLDGTLLDTLPTIKYHLNVTLVKYGLRPVGDCETKRYIGDGAYKLIYRAFSEQGICDEEAIAEALTYYKAHYDAAPLDLTSVYDGICELLRGLKEKGIKVLVLSNKPDLAARMVVGHFFGDAFALVRGGLDGVPLKPDPTSALDMLKQLGANPSECAFVGDTAVDIQTGKNMGAALTVGVLWGFREREELVAAGADTVTASVPEILLAIGGCRD